LVTVKDNNSNRLLSQPRLPEEISGPRHRCNRCGAAPHFALPSPTGPAAMDMQGERRIPAPRQAVWEKLNDPETLKQCIPGCESIEKVSDTEFTAKVVARVGPVRASFSGKVTLSELDPPS